MRERRTADPLRREPPRKYVRPGLLAIEVLLLDKYTVCVMSKDNRVPRLRPYDLCHLPKPSGFSGRAKRKYFNNREASGRVANHTSGSSVRHVSLRPDFPGGHLASTSEGRADIRLYRLQRLKSGLKDMLWAKIFRQEKIQHNDKVKERLNRGRGTRGPACGECRIHPGVHHSRRAAVVVESTRSIPECRSEGEGEAWL